MTIVREKPTLDQVNRLYAALEALARVQEYDEENASTSDNSGSDALSSDSEQEDSHGIRDSLQEITDLPEAERPTYQAQLVAKIQAVQGGDSQLHYDRFRGPAANYRTVPRKSKKRFVAYRESFSARWAAKSTVNQKTYDKAQTADPSMTIFQLQIPDGFFLNEDRGYLGDSERGFADESGTL